MASAVNIRSDFRNRLLIRIICILTVLFFFSKAYAQQSYSISTCSGLPFNFIQPGAVDGTTYSWAVPVILPAAGAITGGSAQAGAQSSVSQNLTNTTTAQATATYIVTTSNFTTFQLVVTVNPFSCTKFQ